MLGIILTFAPVSICKVYEHPVDRLGILSTIRGDWGLELSAIVGDVALRFLGVDGPRWMLRGVIAGPQSQAAQAPLVLRDIVRRTIVDRGDAPMPVRTPLAITLPEAVQAHIAAQQEAQQG